MTHKILYPSTYEGTTLVLGGTGKTGRRVAAGLHDRGADVRIGSRSATPSTWLHGSRHRPSRERS